VYVLQKIIIKFECDILSSGNILHWIKAPKCTLVLMFMKASHSDICKRHFWTFSVPR
jgi:hypothetical protein